MDHSQTEPPPPPPQKEDLFQVLEFTLLPTCALVYSSNHSQYVWEQRGSNANSPETLKIKHVISPT